MQNLVVFYKGNKVTLAWDPPSVGVVDHYVIELTTAKEFPGPGNVVSWVTYFTTKKTQYTIPAQDGYTYSFRVKAVGPAGNESPFSDEQVTVICDSSEPRLNISSFENVKSAGGDKLSLKGEFSDHNIASIRVNGKRADIDLASKTWHVTIPIDQDNDLVTIVARDYAGNSFSRRFKIRRTSTVIDTDPQGADIYVMGTPAYPGIFFTRSPVNIPEIVDPKLNFPVTLRKTGYMQSNTVLSFAGDKEKVVLPLRPLASPASYSCLPVQTPEIKALNEMPYVFVADMDLDNDYEIVASYPNRGMTFILKSLGSMEENSWNAAPVHFALDEKSGKTAVITGQPFVIDYDGDFEYEMAAPVDADKKIHIFESNGTASWKTDQEASLILAKSDEQGPRTFGFLDWNHDHNKDLFFKKDGEQTIHILINKGSDIMPQYPDPGEAYFLQDLNPASPLSICDWNADGEADFLGQDTSGSLCVWIASKQDDQVDFSKLVVPIPSSVKRDAAMSAAAVDWNRDGIYDLVIGTDSGDLFLLIGKQEHIK